MYVGTYIILALFLVLFIVTIVHLEKSVQEIKKEHDKYRNLLSISQKAHEATLRVLREQTEIFDAVLSMQDESQKTVQEIWSRLNNSDSSDADAAHKEQR